MDKTPALPAHEIRPEFEYVYHWHRIIPAIASLAIGAGAVLWFWPSSVSIDNNQTVASTVPAVELKAKSVVVDIPLQLNKPAEQPAHPQAADTLAASANKSVNQATSAAAMTAPAKANVAALKEINEAPAPSAGIKAGKVLTSDKTIQEAALRQIIDHDPLDIPSGVISLNKKKAVKVVFSASVGKPNEQINYLWYLNGKLQAKVATRSTPEARSMASKFISYDTPGEWQVQMTNADGKVLAESAFSAKRNQ